MLAKSLTIFSVVFISNVRPEGALVGIFFIQNILTKGSLSIACNSSYGNLNSEYIIYAVSIARFNSINAVRRVPITLTSGISAC